MRALLSLIVVALVTALVATVAPRPNFFDPAHAQTQLGPNVTALTIGGTATMAAIGANPTRRAVTICNGHATQTATFTFGTAVTPVSLTTGQVLATGNVATSCFTTPGAIQSGVGAQINLIASGASTPVTVFEY